MPIRLTKIALAEEMAVLAVILVIVLFFIMATTLKAVVMCINCLMVHMQRREHHQRQVRRQQHPRSYAPKPVHSTRLGFLGNQPLSTRFLCWKSSRMDQKQEKATTPKIVDRMMALTNKEAARQPKPVRRNIHQQLVPKWYSALMTMGWKSPMQRNVAAPMMIPERFMAESQSFSCMLLFGIPPQKYIFFRDCFNFSNLS